MGQVIEAGRKVGVANKTAGCGAGEVTAGISVNNKSPIYSSRGKIEGGSLEPSVFYPLSPQIRIANEGRHTGTATPEMWLSRCSSS
jgi:hypothetical protein